MEKKKTFFSVAPKCLMKFRLNIANAETVEQDTFS